MLYKINNNYKFKFSLKPDTCGLDPPVPHLKLGENIHGWKIIFYMVYSWNFFSNYYVRRSCLAYRHVLVSISFRSRKMKILLHFVQEKLKFYYIIYIIIYVDILGLKRQTELHETSFMLLTSDSVVIICKNIAW